MADIKTRDLAKGTIKTIDKAAVAGERMKRAYISTKERAEHSTHAAENSADEYASDKVEHGADATVHEGVRQFDKAGRKGLRDTKENVRKAKDGIDRFKEKRAEQSLKNQVKNVGNKTIKTVEKPTEKTVKQSATSAGKKTIKTVGKGSGKAAAKSVKTAERTAKTAIKTTQQAAKTAQKTAQVSIKAAQKAAQVAYVKNPDQAETVRMIYDMYLDGKGTMVIANELTRLQRLNASGKNRWSAGVIARILNNQTYMGIMAYGKSYSNNYLEQKRVNNSDTSTYMYVKADFEPIVSEEEWQKCQEIKSKRVSKSFKSANEASALKKNKQHGIRENKDLWGSKLQCSCGHSFRKNRWHKNKGMPWSYGYQCYNQLNNGSASQRRKAGVDDTGFCDQSMIADWKLEMMAKMIFEHIWQDRKEAIDTVCHLIKECYQFEQPKKVNLTGIVAQIERYKNKKSTLLEMRTDGEITKEEYKAEREKIDKAITELSEEYERMLATEKTAKAPDICWDKIKSSLEEMVDFSEPQIDRRIIKKFVSKIVPNGKNHFRWYMNLDGNDTTALDMVTEGRKSHAVISFNEDEEGEPPLHNGTVIWFKEIASIFADTLKNEKPCAILNEQIEEVNGKKSSIISILHRQLSRMAGIK